MNNLYKVFLIYVGILAGLHAQIQIDRQDIPQTPGIQMNFTVYEDIYLDNSIPVDVGIEGGPQVWDFSAPIQIDTMFQYMYNESIEVIDYKQSQFADSFPDANLAWKILSGDTTPVFLFFNVTDQFFATLGAAAGYQGTITVTRSSDYFGIFPLPIRYQDANAYSYSDTLVFPNGELITNTTVYDTVDAYGTIQLPSGSYECLRIHSTEQETEIYIFNGDTSAGGTFTHNTYTWLTKERFLAASVDGEPVLSKNNTMVNANYIIVQQNQVVGIEEDNYAATNFVLRQNYPNPFNPVTTIPFSIKDGGYIELILYNTTGQKIKTILSGYYNSGEYQVSFSAENLSSGTYYYQLKTDNGNQVRKMVLLK